MISIIDVQKLTNNRSNIYCLCAVDTNSRDVAISALNKLSLQDEDLNLFLASGDWRHVDFWVHNEDSIRNEHIKVMNLYDCEQ